MRVVFVVRVRMRFSFVIGFGIEPVLHLGALAVDAIEAGGEKIRRADLAVDCLMYSRPWINRGDTFTQSRRLVGLARSVLVSSSRSAMPACFTASW